MFRSIVAISALMMAVSPALSQSPSTASDHVRNLAKNGLDVRSIQQRVFSSFFKVAPTGRLTQEMAETVVLRDEAKKRHDTLSLILRNDLDGDGIVSAEEIDRAREVLLGHDRISLENMVLEVDADENGTLSETEIEKRVKEVLAKKRESSGGRSFVGPAFKEFDVDGDGVVEAEEVKVSVRRIAQEATQRKEQKTSRVSRDSRQLKPATNCRLPAPSAETQAIYIGGGRGISVSTVAIDGVDKTTSFATLEIEKGTQPLYIVSILGDTMVLRVTGATERVERFVVGGDKVTGVVGLPADVVTFVPSADCKIPSAREPDTMNWSQANSALTHALDRKVQMIVDYSFGRLQVPSGQNTKPKTKPSRYSTLVIRKGKERFRMTEDGFVSNDQCEGANEEEPREIHILKRKLASSFPGGIEIIVPEEVLTNGKAVEYDVLPREAGLTQLVKSGALSKQRDGTYSINKPFARFPAGISDLRFILRSGVPIPEGDLGRGGIFIEETGKCLGRC